MANITQSFLESALGEQITKFEINPGSNLGDNYASLLYTIDVTLKKGGQVRHLLLKCYPMNAGRQEFLGAGNIFQRELLVYDTFIPELIKFQKDAGSFIKPPFADFVYGCAVDYRKQASRKCDDPLENCIIMPDLRKTGGFRLANRLVGFDLDHCNLVVVAQAQLHSLSWAYKARSKLDTLVTKFPFLGGSFLEDFDPKTFDVMFDGSLSLFCGAIEAEVKDEKVKATLLDAITKFRVNMSDIMAMYFSDASVLNDSTLTRDNILRIPGEVKKDETIWQVGLHGDCWLNNMMFRYDEVTGKPLEVVLVDLQMTREGDPLSDLQYSLFTSTTAAFRKAHMDDLLALYVKTFTEICQKFQVEPPCDFNLKELQRRFHRGKVFGLACCLNGFPIFLNDPKNAVDLDAKKEGGEEEDFVTALSHMTTTIAGSTNFQMRAVDVVREMYEQGVI